MGQDQPPLKDRAKVTTARRLPDIVVCASGSGLQADAKPGPKSE